jgi:hypothetical protein
MASTRSRVMWPVTLDRLIAPGPPAKKPAEVAPAEVVPDSVTPALSPWAPPGGW